MTELRFKVLAGVLSHLRLSCGRVYYQAHMLLAEFSVDCRTKGLRFFVVVIVVLYWLSFGSCPEYLSWLLSEDCFQFFVTQASPT